MQAEHCYTCSVTILLRRSAETDAELQANLPSAAGPHMVMSHRH